MPLPLVGAMMPLTVVEASSTIIAVGVAHPCEPVMVLRGGTLVTSSEVGREVGGRVTGLLVVCGGVGIVVFALVVLPGTTGSETGGWLTGGSVVVGGSD